ncbi:MAG: B12-binding domain-containing radical SAM protein [Vicinamibacterales bacterium]|nr:B12-binding domain-containing radical SAM protein [Vicinamibacterales bacterium]
MKFILPALTEATSPYWRPIKYSLFPPLGLATLAAFLTTDDCAVLVDEHVQKLDVADRPDLVLIQVYITNAYRAYRIADHYRARGAFVALGGLHVTSLPDEAAAHADAVFLGPAEQTFPQFLADFRAGRPQRVYRSLSGRTLDRLPPVRRDLIERRRYLVPNSIVVTRGCPEHCDFCYKDAFFEGGRSFYTQRVDDALGEIARLPGRHLYFLDDHLLGDRRFARALFDGMRGANRLFQAAATVDSVLRGDLIERAAEAGLRSLFVGFESLSPANLAGSNKRQNLGRDYKAVTDRLHSLGIMINGSFVFGMDDDDEDVFRRTVDWAIEQGITTATFHIQTPYPGTRLFARMQEQGRIATNNWDLYDTRHVVFRPARMTPDALEEGYNRAYRDFYTWSSIARASRSHGSVKHQAKHFFYASGWKKFEPLWNLMIRARQLGSMTPLLEAVLSNVSQSPAQSPPLPPESLPLSLESVPKSAPPPPPPELPPSNAPEKSGFPGTGSIEPIELEAFRSVVSSPARLRRFV